MVNNMKMEKQGKNGILMEFNIDEEDQDGIPTEKIVNIIDGLKDWISQRIEEDIKNGVVEEK